MEEGSILWGGYSMSKHGRSSYLEHLVDLPDLSRNLDDALVPLLDQRLVERDGVVQRGRLPLLLLLQKQQ